MNLILPPTCSRIRRFYRWAMRCGFALAGLTSLLMFAASAVLLWRSYTVEDSWAWLGRDVESGPSETFSEYFATSLYSFSGRFPVGTNDIVMFDEGGTPHALVHRAGPSSVGCERLPHDWRQFGFEGETTDKFEETAVLIRGYGMPMC